MQDSYDYLYRVLQQVANQHTEKVLIIPSGYSGMEYTSVIPYGVLESLANIWEKKNNVGIVYPGVNL